MAAYVQYETAVEQLDPDEQDHKKWCTDWLQSTIVETLMKWVAFMAKSVVPILVYANTIKILIYYMI